MNSNRLVVLTLLALLLIPGCSSNSPTNPDTGGAYGTVVYFSECKYTGTSSTSDDTPPNLDCLYFDYDGSSRLDLLHANGAFNCCPGEIYAVFSFDGNRIIIEEDETDASCMCVCLFDVEYMIEGLPPGTYEVEIAGAWLPPGEAPLVCQLELPGPVTGDCCLERTHSPWG